MYDFEEIRKEDPEIAEAIQAEMARQNSHIELIASENWVSKAVMAAMGSPLTNKYAEGYPGKRYYGGCQCVDVAENLAIERAKKLFGCEYVNVQPHSGAQANMAVQFAMLTPGDKVMGMNLDHGGHLTHGSPVNMSGKYFEITPYGVNEEGVIDYEEVRRIAKECRPKLIIAGASAYARIIDFKKFREIADEVGAYLMVDMAHIAGLVAAGLHPSPIPYAHVTTTTTHKTLRGPRGGMILSSNEMNEKFNFNKAIFPGIQGGPLMHVIAAKAVCFKEALSPDFVAYQEQILKNAKALCNGLLERGVKIVSGGTDNHLMLVDLTGTNVSGKELEKRLDQAHITCNKNTIPNDPRSPFVTSGVRLGTPAVTSRGMKEQEMDQIAEMIAMVIRDEKNVEQVKENVKFLRIDAGVTDAVKEEGKDLEEETKTLSEIFKKALKKENLTIKVESLKNDKVSSMMTISEENRRMQEMMKMYNMYGMDPSMFGGQETLVLNANNKLVQYVLENKENENVDILCEQLYDLALISHRQLTPEEMTKFVTRSNEIMLLLAK